MTIGFRQCVEVTCPNCGVTGSQDRDKLAKQKLQCNHCDHKFRLQTRDNDAEEGNRDDATGLLPAVLAFSLLAGFALFLFIVLFVSSCEEKMAEQSVQEVEWVTREEFTELQRRVEALEQIRRHRR